MSKVIDVDFKEVKKEEGEVSIQNVQVNLITDEVKVFNGTNGYQDSHHFFVVNSRDGTTYCFPHHRIEEVSIFYTKEKN